MRTLVRPAIEPAARIPARHLAAELRATYNARHMSDSSPTYLVTGGAGFIGSNLVAAFAERQARIVVCDYDDDAGRRRNLAKRELADWVTPPNLFAYLRDRGNSIDGVFHLGAVSSTVATDWELVVHQNYGVPLRLWDWCAGRNVSLIYASSAATYGGGEAGFDDDGSAEGLAKLTPLNPYGWSKHIFDRKVAEMVGNGEPAPRQWAGLKFFNVYGPNEYHKGGQRSVVPQIYERIADGGPARLFKSHHPDYADGGQLRDFIWVGDCVDVMLWLLDHPAVNGLFNCGTGRARSFEDLAVAVFKALGKNADIEYVPTPENIRDKYQYFTEARMERLLAAGYDKTFTALEDGVRRYVRDYLIQDDPFK